MALIACPECGKEISDAAQSCPNCGMPIASKDERAAGAKLTTIQETSKKLKLHSFGGMLLALVGFVMGALWFVSDLSDANSGGIPDVPIEVAIVGAAVMVVGLVWSLVTGIRIWWHHG